MLRIFLLGRFEVSLDGEPAGISSRPAQTLLAYLALNPEVHRRERLAGVLWPDSSEKGARDNLRHALWRLRKDLDESFFLADRETIGLDRARVWIDTAALEALELPAASTEALAEALSHYQGELLPDSYEDWAALERARLEAAYQANMQELLRRLLDEGRWRDALAWAEKWISLGQVPEPAFRALMSAHAALGDAAATAASYQRCVSALRDELGVEPSPETRELFKRLSSGERPQRANAPSPAAARTAPERGYLPAQTTPFIGREGEVSALIELLKRPEVRLVTLTGPGGTGKTRLAIEVAAALTDAFAGEVRFADLAPVATSDFVPSAVAHAVGLTEQGSESVLDSLRAYLSGRRMMLVVDNFEHLITAAPVLSELLAVAPEVKLLVTSRETLKIQGEHAFPVPPLPLPKPGAEATASSLERSEAARLFVERARAASPAFELSDENAPAIAEICRRLDGLPLAIELAAPRIRLFSPQALLKRLRETAGVLASAGRDAPAHQRTLRAALEWSEGLLDAEDRRLFRRLAVFAGGWSLATVEAVCQHGLDRPVVDGLQSLVEKSLVYRAGGAPEEVRFRMLETIREFASGRFEDSPEMADVRRLHAEYFAGFTEQGADGLLGPESLDWIGRLETDHDNFRAALKWCLDGAGDAALGLRMAGALGRFWEVRSNIHEGRERLAAALERAGDGGPDRARALSWAGQLAYRGSDYGASQSYLEEALAAYRTLDDKPGVASCLIGLANLATEHGDYDRAPQMFQEALELSREAGDLPGVEIALRNLAWAAMRTGDIALAKAHLNEALDIARRLGDKQGEGMCLSGLGEAYLREGELEHAREYLQLSLELRTELGNKWGMGASLGSLAWVALRQGELERAETLLRESLAMRIEIAERGGMAWCLEKLAETAIARENPDRAARLYGAASALRESIHSVIDPADQPEYERRLAELRAALGEAEFGAAWSAGQRMTAGDLAALAHEAPAA